VLQPQLQLLYVPAMLEHTKAVTAATALQNKERHG
jgi:hypothetical protein